MKGVIYTRVSSEEQIEGTSLGSQEELCRRYCEQRGIEVAAVFREEGETAKDLSLNNRSQFLAALEFCRKAKDVGGFVVYRVDRFARNTEDHFAVRRILSISGTSLYSVTEPIGNKPAEKFIETVLAGAAEYDNAIRKQRCVDGMIARIKQGIWPLRPPIGYICAQHRKRGEKKAVPDQPNPRLFPIVQRALRTYDQGEVTSLVALAEQLNLWGYATLTGKVATKQTVDRMLGKYLRFYAGILQDPWSGTEHAGLHIPMIDRGAYERIRLRRAGRRVHAKTKRNHFSPAFPLRRLIRCAACNAGLTGAVCRGNGGYYHYYYCVNQACLQRNKSLKAGVLENAFRDFLSDFAPAADQIPIFEQRLGRFLDEYGVDRAADIGLRQTRREELMNRRKRVLEMREDGTYDAATFRERLRAVDADVAALDATAGELGLASLDRHELIASGVWLVTRLPLLWEKISPESRLRFESIFFPEGIRHDGDSSFRTTKPGLILGLLRQDAEVKSADVHLGGLSSNQVYEYCKEMLAYYAISSGDTTVAQEEKPLDTTGEILFQRLKRRHLSKKKGKQAA